MSKSGDLRALIGADRVDDSAVTLEAYARDATPEFHQRPDVVVFPESTDEVAAVVRYARQTGTAIVPRGSGTNLCAATVPPSGAIVLSVTRMNRIIEVSRSELLAVVQPGVTSADLDLSAAAEGLLFPPDPGSRIVSTIGGNISTCAGGLRGLKYGVTRDYVLGLEIVIGTGEVIRAGGRLVRDVAGYDLTRLLAGSEGTLGVITEATLSLRPRPTCYRGGVAYFRSLEESSRAVEAIISAGLLPATLEFLDRTCINMVEDFAQLGLRRSAGALLLFGDDGDEKFTIRQTERMAAICRDTDGFMDVTLAQSDAEWGRLLEARRWTLPSLARRGSLCIQEDITVSRPQLASAVAGIADISNRHEVLIGTFGHAGDGTLHPTVVVDHDDANAVLAAHKAINDIFELALKLGGTITGEHGVGLAKLKYLERRIGPEHVSLLRRLKGSFDPDGILNPGKLGS